MADLPARVLFGAAYYHEYHPAYGPDVQPDEQLKTDLDLMAEAHFTVIRVGESVWSTWEPENGRFELDWLRPVLDGAHERGISVILGTPTYAVPPWLARQYPEITGERSTGERIGWGARQEVDFTHPAFRFHAERIIREVVARYAGHPAVIGFQVDNEPGLELFHNHGVFQRFTDHLRAKYGDVETLNREWGLVYWSHRLSTWADLWTPDGNVQPQYDVAWREFQARQCTEFIGWQADIVREYAPPRALRHDLHLLHPPGGRGRRTHRPPRHRHRQPLLRHAGRPAPARPHPGHPRTEVEDHRRLVPLPDRRLDVLLPPGTVPRHRDQRHLHRHGLGQPARLRRPVAPGRLGPRRPRCPHDRVLAVADPALRRRDLLGRSPPAQRTARSYVRRTRAAGRRVRDRGSARRAGLEPDADITIVYSTPASG